MSWKDFSLTLSLFVQACAAFIIAVAVVKGIGLYVLQLVRPADGAAALDRNRLALARSLSLSLEFLIGADILRTAVAPTWTDIGQLAAIVAIRTTLNYFLARELAQVPPERA
jgi:uncharacterized membrane protein